MNIVSPIPVSPSNKNDPIAKIRGILGEQAVLIPVRVGTKAPMLAAWPTLSLSCMDDPVHLNLLKRNNIGVLLGPNSGGLCSIDFDNDEFLELFLNENPRFHGTTRTRRVRGCNLWLYVVGEIPPSTKLVAAGLAIGEWRANGNHTVIHGRVIDKKKGETEPTEYRFLNESSPIHIRFEEIVWPPGCSLEARATDPPPIRLNTESLNLNTESLNSEFCVSASLHNMGEAVLENIKLRAEAVAALKISHPHLLPLYEQVVEPRFHALPGARNDFIVQGVPFLYRVVAAKFVLDLIGCFYDCNRALFNDSRDTHMKEADAMLKAVTETYAGSLDDVARGIYDALPEDEQDAFRICRDLALRDVPGKPVLGFYMSFNQLAFRVGLHPPQAQRLMRRFQGVGLIKQVKKGTRRSSGERAEAGEYLWLSK